MKILKYAGAAAALALTMGMASVATADTYHLTVDGSSTGLGGDGDYGTVTVTTIANGLDFVVALDSNTEFMNTGGHTTFAFTLNGDTGQQLVFSSVTGWTSAGPGSFPDPSIGSFEYGLECTTACPGPVGNNTQNLHFTITGTSGTVLTLAGITAGGTNTTVYGAADLRNRLNSATGAVGFTAGGVPEPATWAMMILGLGMVGAGMRMRRRSPMLA